MALRRCCGPPTPPAVANPLLSSYNGAAAPCTPSAIDQSTAQSTHMLTTIGACPYGTKSEPTEDEHRPVFYGSDMDPLNYSIDTIALILKVWQAQLL
jgi:hypothetical protein